MSVTSTASHLSTFAAAERAWRRGEARRRRKRRRTGYCSSCQDWGKLTRHHVYPRRFYKPAPGDTSYQPVVVRLCHGCHVHLERIISKKEGAPQRRLAYQIYEEITNWFLATNLRFNRA